MNLEHLKNFCADNGLTQEQINALFQIIKEINNETINECYKTILSTLEAKK